MQRTVEKVTDPLDAFHPAVSAWFRAAFSAPTPAQAEAWPAIGAGRHTLVAAPTGSGKTLAAFLSAIDSLVRDGLEGPLPDETRVVYVSPLKALANDIERNLRAPLAGIRAQLQALGYPDVDISTLVRTGDTPQAERTRMRKKAPHIVVTTPESLYILLTSASGRKMLSSVRSVIVDEIHAVAPNKRGAHLAVSLERLAALAGPKLVRIGLSATQKPIEEIGRFLAGTGGECTIVDTGHVRSRDLAVEIPASPLEAVMSGEVWIQVYDRLAELIGEHRTTLVFVNTRRMAERVAKHLTDRLGKGNVTSHHGSMAREHRLDAEQRLKRGELKALVATASLELGIDIGDVDLVCQLGATRSIAAFLQRVGRSGHAVGGTPKGRLFPLSRDELVECAALLDAVRRGELDRIEIPENPLDVLAQQIVAEVSGQEWTEEALLSLLKGAYPYRNLETKQYVEVLQMLAAGFDTRRGRRSAYLHRDAVNGVLRGRRGAGITAMTSGGTIPDTADYSVVLEPQSQPIGTVNEDFAIESLAGDVFQLGNTSYRILRVERGTVRVEDAKGAPPGIPFWLGEAPGRTIELSQALSRLHASCSKAFLDEAGMSEGATQQILEYLTAAKAVFGALPTLDTIILERFFDESGGQQLVIHAPFGSRINRAWGLALRKRMCRKFNFELQAAATENSIILSLSTSHSFPLEDLARYLHSNSVRPLLVQALLDAPMFATRWRWDATTALALPRFRGGRKVPPQIARMESEDLLASVFPDQLACGENIVGDREVPDHPLVNQTIHDCLHDAMDIEGLEAVLRRMEKGEIAIVARDLTEPSPLALEVLSARPYAFLDDVPLEERRTHAVMARRYLDPQTAADLGKLDPEAIARAISELKSEPRNPDELHDVLMSFGFLAHSEVNQWKELLEGLMQQKRATAVHSIYCAAERLPELLAIFPDAKADIPVLEELQHRLWSREEALREVVRDRLQGSGPTTSAALAAALGVGGADMESTLLALESEGSIMRGRFTPDAAGEEWCERRVLARIHRYTVNRLRAEIEPVELRDFLRFLFHWQRVSPEQRVEGPDAVAGVVSQLEGFEAPAAAWETEILPSRVNEYDPGWLDELSLAGRVAWSRVLPPKTNGERPPSPVRTTPIVLAPRRSLPVWTGFSSSQEVNLSSRGEQIKAFFEEHGASFFEEIVEGTGALRVQAEEALGELVAQGIVSADSFAGLRALLVPSDRRRAPLHGRKRRGSLFGLEDAGRWSLVRRKAAIEYSEQVEHAARALLRRYGVVFWRLTEREADWLPPWRDLLRCYRRLEARGEIRGGRFVAGVAGEQFAAPEAIGLLRDARRAERNGTLISVSGADPLNLVGILTPGPRLASLRGNRVLYRDGVPLALLAGGEVRFLDEVAPQMEWTARNALLRRQVPPTLAALE
ncbi:MAG TPA: DEAD/DEAH box helicase [Burkholderiales bacterium]|nr:DEAD/DEAH box helicase [Burkholderiales bacterium]